MKRVEINKRIKMFKNSYICECLERVYFRKQKNHNSNCEYSKGNK